MKQMPSFLRGLWAFSAAFFLAGFLSAQPVESNLPDLAEALNIIPRHLSEKCSRPRGNSEVTHVVLHFSSNVIQKPTDPYRVEDVVKIFEDYGVSAHYLIDREGRVYELVPSNRVAFHAGKGKLPHAPYYPDVLNAHSIGIELLGIGSAKDMRLFMSQALYQKVPPHLPGFTEAQYTSLASLLRKIQQDFPSIRLNRRHIVGHEEYTPDRRSDPGELFDWSRLNLQEGK